MYMNSKPKLAVPSCLLGKEVCCDGDATEFRNLNQDWSESFELVEVCPEVELGMGVSSSALRLNKDRERISLINPENGEDHTEAMAKYAEKKSDDLVASGISGFVFSKDSPVFGLEKVKVYRGDNPKAVQDGSGLFTMVFTTLYPHIPVIEEVKLIDPLHVEHFLARVQFFHEWQTIGNEGWTAEKIISFHDENKLFSLSRAPEFKEILDRIIAEGFNNNEHPEHVALNYMTEAQKRLSTIPNKGRITQSVQRALGRLPQISKPKKTELLDVVQNIRR